MYQKDLDALISSDKFRSRNSFLLFGQSRYLSGLYVEKILQPFVGEADILKMYFDEYDFDSSKSFLGQSSLFGDRLILVLKSDKKIQKKELKDLLDTAKKNSGMIIYEYYDDISVKKEDYHLLFDSFTRFFQPDSIYSVMQLAKTEVAKNGVVISDSNLTKIVNSLNLDMELISNEIRKLSIFNGEISDEIISNVVLDGENIAQDKFFELVLGKKNFAHELEYILERQSASEIDTIMAFQRYLYDILMAKLAIKLFGDPKEALPSYQRMIPEKVLKIREHYATTIKDQVLSKIIDFLLDLEMELKTTKPNADKKLMLIQTLIKIQSYL